MKWKTPDGDNLYKEEVLAFNLADWLVGYIFKHNDGSIYCKDKNTMLPRVMYYIPVKDLELDLEQSDTEE